MLEGHCVLTLPEDGRYIDATVCDAPLNREDTTDCRFLLDGTEPGVPVDELPLPAGVPAEASGPARLARVSPR